MSGGQRYRLWHEGGQDWAIEPNNHAELHDKDVVLASEYAALLDKIAELEALLREINHCHCDKCDACYAASCVG